MSKKIRALLIAEAANPEWTSVPLVGWSHAIALREQVEAHVVTQIRNCDAIVRAGLKLGEDFTAIDSEKVARPLWKVSNLIRGGANKGWTTATAISAISYFYFEYLVWREFGARIKAGEFDVVHRITPLSPTTPSRLARKCASVGVPFVLGPLNGGVPWPSSFGSERKKEKEWLAPMRSAYKLLPGYRSTLKYSAAIIVGSTYTQSQIPAKYAAKVSYIPENAIDPARFSAQRTREPALPLRLLFVGRLVPYKGADMAIEAAGPLLAAGKATLTFVGDGPEIDRLKELAAPWTDAVRFAGNVAHEQVQLHFVESDVFVFPSIREFGGGVILEAMAMGCVPAAVAYGGPAELMTADTSRAVDIGTREQIVNELRQVLRGLVEDPKTLIPLAHRGRERVLREFTWDAKARQVVNVYQQVLNQNE